MSSISKSSPVEISKSFITDIDFSQLRIGYVPCAIDMKHPGDRRRFYYYAKKRGISYEIAKQNEHYDLVVLTQHADLSYWSKYKNNSTIIIYDLIDSYLSIPYTSIKGLFRGLAKYFVGQSEYLKVNHWESIRDMCRKSDAIICSTEEQKKLLLGLNNNVHRILDFHDYFITTNKLNYTSSDRFNLVWEGLPQNIDQFYVLNEALIKISKKYNIALHVVTDPYYKKYMGKFASVDTLSQLRKLYKNSYLYNWNIYTLASIICAFDLAIIPIDLTNKFTSGKPVNKLLLFWRMAMPVIASATKANIKTMNDAGILMYCKNTAEWEEMLETYINNETMRKESAEAGSKFVEDKYSTNILMSHWDYLFKSVLN